MNIENAKSQMRKGMLEYCVLLLLEHRPSYAIVCQRHYPTTKKCRATCG